MNKINNLISLATEKMGKIDIGDQSIIHRVCIRFDGRGVPSEIERREETVVNEGYEIVREIHRYVNDTLIEYNGRDNDSRFRHYIYGFLFKVSA